jgi:hypothetical protein
VSGLVVYVLRRIYPYLYRSMPVLFGRLSGMGAGGRLAGVRLLVENLVVRFAFILYKMSIAAGSLYSFMARQLLSKTDTFRMINDGNKVMTEIMYPDGLRINTRFDGAALDGVPHTIGLDRLDKIANPLIVANKQRGGLQSIVLNVEVARNKIVSYSANCSVGKIYNRLLVSLSDNNGSLLKKIHVTDTDIASLRDTKSAISQKEDKSPVSQVLRFVSHSISMFDYLLDAVLVEQDKSPGGLEGISLISHSEKGSVNTWVGIGGEKIQALDSGSVEGLRGRVHAGSLFEEINIRFFGEFSATSDKQKFFKSHFIGDVCLWAARLIHELQIGCHSVFHDYLSFHLMPIISNKK